MYRRLLIAFAAPLGCLALYGLWQCALPRHALVRAAFAVPGTTHNGVAVDVDSVAAKHLPLGMNRRDALWALRRAGFRMKPRPEDPWVPMPCRECDEMMVGRYDESILCGGEAISVAIGFRDGRLVYLSAARVMREFYI
ncbi:MAG TPA: hypothetical protein VGB24_16240 [Longimicrobium sp.]|jgi:hypothetical protein|uniref:hypothetical protein n=1 Tax=Longimicrobium sp. TaxID=2029185 RepID=UPI002ED92E42